MQDNAAKTLNEKKKAIEKEIGSSAKINTISLIGDSVSGKILELADKEKVDLIVIGNVGLSGVLKLKTLGSVSRAISERSPCPVLIVH